MSEIRRLLLFFVCLVSLIAPVLSYDWCCQNTYLVRRPNIAICCANLQAQEQRASAVGERVNTLIASLHHKAIPPWKMIVNKTAHKDRQTTVPTIFMRLWFLPNSLARTPRFQARTTQQQYTSLHIACGVVVCFLSAIILHLYYIIFSIVLQ